MYLRKKRRRKRRNEKTRWNENFIKKSINIFHIITSFLSPYRWLYPYDETLTKEIVRVSLLNIIYHAQFNKETMVIFNRRLEESKGGRLARYPSKTNSHLERWRQQPRRSATRMHHPGECEGVTRGAAEREREIERRHRFSQSPPVVRECIETIFHHCVSARCAFPTPGGCKKEEELETSRWISRAHPIHRSNEGN